MSNRQFRNYNAFALKLRSSNESTYMLFKNTEAQAKFVNKHLQ